MFFAVSGSNMFKDDILSINTTPLNSNKKNNNKIAYMHVSGPSLFGKVSIQHMNIGSNKDKFNDDDLILTIKYTNSTDLPLTDLIQLYITKDMKFDELDVPLCQYLVFEIENKSNYNASINVTPCLR